MRLNSLFQSRTASVDTRRLLIYIFSFPILALGTNKTLNIFLLLIGVMCHPSWFRFQWGQVKTSSAALSAVQRQQEKSAKVGIME